MLGYLNFSGGKPEPRFQKQLNDALAYLGGQGVPEPWHALHQQLVQKLEELQAGDSSAFREATQVKAVLSLVFTRCLRGYRRHHADLLFHLEDADLYGPFFLARVFEAVLAQGPPWTDEDRVVNGALTQLNDFVGYRPIAILETRPKGEPYGHERVRPIPLYIKGVGVAWGPYQALVARALEILAASDPSILAEACFQQELLDELALDPRPYDQGHPVHRRPNYIFGEWDPDHLDNQGRYRRFVLRHVVLEGLRQRVEMADEPERTERLFEAAAVLAGTILMAAGTSGSDPTTHDSTTTLATLLPRIARYRDTFYAGLLNNLTGSHGERLREEAKFTRQPFGRARQHLNEYLSEHRARQLQHRHVALLYAEMGYADASRREAARIPVASVRMLSEIRSRLATGRLLVDQGRTAEAAQLLPEIEAFLQRGIDCGAIVDPWNVLGFQGMFPLFTAREDAIHDPRIDDLTLIMEQVFNFYSRLMSDAAALGDKPLIAQLKPALRRLAAWWDRFATISVDEVRRVDGAEAASSAEHVASALRRWHEQGEATSDLAFWKKHLDKFRSPKAFALVISALLRKSDYQASLALLINWVGQAELVSLELGEHSFHTEVVRWMLGATTGPNMSWKLVKKFFDYLEANAGDYWQVPSLEADLRDEGDDDEDGNLFEAAYEDVTFEDSADDDQEGDIWDGPPETEFLLASEGAGWDDRLEFLTTLARLWQLAARSLAQRPSAHQPEAQAKERPSPAHQPEALARDTRLLALQAGVPQADAERTTMLQQWSTAAQDNLNRLFTFLEAVQAYPIPEPLGSHDSMVEYDLNRTFKEELLNAAIDACLDTAEAVRTLRGVLGQAATPSPSSLPAPVWEAVSVRLEGAMWRGDRAAVQTLLPEFVEQFRTEPLLFTALADGGSALNIFRARLAQNLLRALVINLPRLGLLRHAYHLLRIARLMEETNRPPGRATTVFNFLYQAGYTACVEAVVEAAKTWPAPPPPEDAETPEQVEDVESIEIVNLLEDITGPFMGLWSEHSQRLQLSAVDTAGPKDWAALQTFIERYGADLFHAKFMTLANLRGILHRGIGAYLDYLRDNPDPLHPVSLIDDLDAAIPRAEAERHLGMILHILVENYEEYKDYNTTTTQSDYGQNLYMLLDFLRLKAQYDRQAWHMKPLGMAHAVLVRQTRNQASRLWQEEFSDVAQQLAATFIEQLTRLEQTHGIRLRTVADRIQERFVKPLLYDRLCALVEPAMEEAGRPEGSGLFSELERVIGEQTAHPTGVGLDVPAWLQTVEAEVHRLQAKRSGTNLHEELHPRVPRQLLSYDELDEQIEDWQKPLQA
jgi:hypothetical protein